MSRSKLLTAFSLLILLGGAAQATDLISITEYSVNSSFTANVSPLVDEALLLELEVRNDEIEITASRLDGQGAEQREEIEFSRDPDDDDFAAFVDLRLQGTKHDDIIDIEFHETINREIMYLQVAAGDGDDTIGVYNSNAHVQQRVMNLESLNVEGPQLYVVLKGQDHDDVMVNETRAFTYMDGGLGRDRLQGGLGPDHFFSEGKMEGFFGIQGIELTIRDRELDSIFDAGGTATVTRFAVPVADQTTPLYRPLVSTEPIDLLTAWKKKQIVAKGKLDRAGVIPGTTISLPNRLNSTLPSKGDSVEAYAIKTTYRWELLDEANVYIDPARVEHHTYFVKPVDETAIANNFLDYVDSTHNPQWELDAPELEPTVEEL